MVTATLDPALELPVHVAEVVAVYAGRVFDVRHFARGAYTVGDDPRASFPLMLAGQGRFPLVCRRAGVIVLRFTAEMRGVLIGGDERSSLGELITSGRATAIDDAFTVALLADEQAVVFIGAVSFMVRSVPAARRPAFSSGLRWEWRRHALVVFMVFVALLLLAPRQPNLIGDVGRDGWTEDLRFVGFVSQPSAARTVRDRIALTPPRSPADGVPRHSGEGGKQGTPMTRSTRGRLAIAWRPVPSDILHTRSFNPEEAQVRGGLLGLYESVPGYFLASPPMAGSTAGANGLRATCGADADAARASRGASVDSVSAAPGAAAVDGIWGAPSPVSAVEWTVRVASPAPVGCRVTSA